MGRIGEIWLRRTKVWAGGSNDLRLKSSQIANSAKTRLQEEELADLPRSKCLFGRPPHDLFYSALLDQAGQDNGSTLVPGVTPPRVRLIPDDWPGCRKVVGHMRTLVKQTKPKVVDAVLARRQADDRLPSAPGWLQGKGA